MKRLGNIYDEICSMENLHAAHRNAQKGKRHYKEVININKNPDYHMQKLHRKMMNGEFKNSEYDIFEKTEPKHRVIYKLPYYPDRIVQHAIMNVCEPTWHNSLIRDTYSSLKGRGVHDGVRRMKLFLEDVAETKYCLKMDVKKFYPSVDNSILFENVIKKSIKCKRTLDLLAEIIFSVSGLPIGNYLSQIWGNLYMSAYDWLMKQQNKVKYYSRYCDDIVIFGKCKHRLHAILNQTREYLCENYKLLIKDNWQIFPVDVRGVDFLGYVFYHGKVRVRKSIADIFKKKMRNIEMKWQNLSATKILNVIMSYYGWVRHADAWKLWNKYVGVNIKRIVKYVCIQQNIQIPKPIRSVI